MLKSTSNPRAEASRRNGTKSKGPITIDGKARASKNALKHGLCAKTTILLESEDEAAFESLEQGLNADLQPKGPLETLLASRLAMAAWRMDRADRIEADLLSPTKANGADRIGRNGRHTTMGETITRDRHGPQAVDCLIRYRGSTQAEFWRALAALRTIQAHREEGLSTHADRAANPPIDVTPRNCVEVQVNEGVIRQKPNEPERR